MHKDDAVPMAKDLVEMGFEVVSTGGTCAYLREAGLNIQRINKVSEGQPHIVDAIINGEIDFMINTTKGQQSVSDGRLIRRTALMHKIPYYTNIAAAKAGVQAIRYMRSRAFTFTPIQTYLGTDGEDAYHRTMQAAKTA